jgi:hypothetical protein
MNGQKLSADKVVFDDAMPGVLICVGKMALTNGNDEVVKNAYQENRAVNFPYHRVQPFTLTWRSSMTDYRKEESNKVRLAASRMAYDREHPEHRSNGDEQRYAMANYAMSFTKGLEHDKATGLVAKASDFEAFRTAIDDGYVDAFTTAVPASAEKCRQWEAPTAGIVYELQGPDSHAVTMPPAPALGSCELAYEMAEVYELALLRDVPFTAFRDDVTGAGSEKLEKSIKNLNAINYEITGEEGRPRKNQDGILTKQMAFRGSSPGVEVGPYLSQFLLIGNDDLAGQYDLTKGMVQYGALQINQRVPVAKECDDYMKTWGEWLSVQNGADTRENADLFSDKPRRFITTPRDMASYVHDDALYEAYLNACLILLGMKTPFDPGFAKLSGSGKLHLNSLSPKSAGLTRYYEIHDREAGGFALWGGPHILTLVTEVATRALKAVRYQKFNTHCRLRPEALAARIARATEIEEAYPCVGKQFSDLKENIMPTINDVKKVSSELLLPMAFQEGSPMHPSYGAGHATVAGACVTILKAFFDTSAVLVKRELKAKEGSFEYKFDLYNKRPDPENPCTKPKDKDKYIGDDMPVSFEIDAETDRLCPVDEKCFLTLEGELNKLAANISIGRNMAGVHYFSDYYDSLRMGEKIAIGILEEQALCYKTDPFVLSLTTFDGDVLRIGRR